MPNLNISVVLSNADVTAINEAIDQLIVLLPFLQNLSAKDRRTIRKMGIKLEGYVKEVSQAAVTFPTAIPGAYPFAEFEKDGVLFDVLTLIASRLHSFVEALDDTLLLIGNERITVADIYYSSLKNAAKKDISMTESLAKISSIFNKKPYAMPVVHTIGPFGSLHIKNVATGTYVVNKGRAVISFKAGNELASKVREPAKIVDPASAEVIPKGWTSIEVTNMSESQEATISVKMK
jgi:hypothetical protein